MNNLATKLMSHERAFASVPAGGGKTYTIAQMLAMHNPGVQLILTHTHAGVQSLAKRLKHQGIHSRDYSLETITGWALRLALAYPQITRWSKSAPDTSDDWLNILLGVTDLLTIPTMKRVIQASYAGVIVDEYQDCTESQHRLVLVLANIIPCRLLGDPLQGIFGFTKHERLVDWEQDVKKEFREVEEDYQPYRWKGKNERLGDWLVATRNQLLNGESISLEDPQGPYKWMLLEDDTNKKALWKSLNSNGTVVAIHPDNAVASKCHLLARQMKGQFQSIETMDAPPLLSWASKLDTAVGSERAVRIIEFAKECCTAVATEMKTILDRFETSLSPDFSKTKKHQALAIQLKAIADQTGFLGVADILHQIREVEGSFLYRADLWHSMIQGLKFYETGNFHTLKDAAWHARQRQKYIGRVEYPRIIARTLLIKGLEYDHAILLDANQFSAKNLYVALTRGAQSLTIVSPTPYLKPNFD